MVRSLFSLMMRGRPMNSGGSLQRNKTFLVGAFVPRTGPAEGVLNKEKSSQRKLQGIQRGDRVKRRREGSRRRENVLLIETYEV